MNLTIIRRNLWIAVVVVGAIFAGTGLFMVSEGMVAKSLVRDMLVAEQITTGDDAAVPNELVRNVATAQAEEALIMEHTLGANGPYSGLERGSPERDSYISGVTLRTALNLAVMGFRVSDLVIGVGAFVAAVGLSNVFLIAPLAFMVGHAQQPGEVTPLRQPEPDVRRTAAAA